MAKRSTPKVSPLRGMPVEEWLKVKASGWQADVASRLIAMAAKAAPKAAVAIKWGQPVI